MQLSILTYNIQFNYALKKLNKILEAYKPDIVCLQEVDTNTQNLQAVEKLHYRIADYSNSFIKFDKIFGVVTLYNPTTLSFVVSESIELPQSISEIILTILRWGNKPRTVLKTKFTAKTGNHAVDIYNVHLTPLATNGARIKQLKETLANIDHPKNHRVIITGDFNYPYRRKKLEELMQQYSFKEATSNLAYTLNRKLGQYNIIVQLAGKLHDLLRSNSLKFDYIFYKHLDIIKTERVPVNASYLSDHFPIISTFVI